MNCQNCGIEMKAEGRFCSRNPECKKARHRTWVAENIEASRAKCRAWYAKNRESQQKRVLANYYIFKERDYERVRAINRKAVARKRFGVSSREEIFARDGHKCLVCGSAEKLVIHHKDHHGRGKEKPNNDPQNLMTVCTSCHAAHHFGHRKMKV